jgi:hypothetical protein
MTTATAVRERPIIFSGPMVKSILAGTKTQTRHIVKPQPGDEWSPVVGHYHPTITRHGEMEPGPEVFGAADEAEGRVCPYGRPRDRLWVREAHKVEPTPGCSFGDAMMARKLSVFYRHGSRKDIANGGSFSGSAIHVDYADIDFPMDKWGRWRPSIFMPRWASRILLDVVSVRVAQLSDMTEADARAEGFACVEEFDGYWMSLNGKRGYPWRAGLWVWVVEFKRITT